jgi:hypothetical protein
MVRGLEGIVRGVHFLTFILLKGLNEGVIYALNWFGWRC